jgi:hypothetical protein
MTDPLVTCVFSCACLIAALVAAHAYSLAALFVYADLFFLSRPALAFVTQIRTRFPVLESRSHIGQIDRLCRAIPRCDVFASRETIDMKTN